MTTTTQSDTGELIATWLKHPREVYRDARTIAAQWRQLGYVSAPDFGRAIAQYDAFVRILADCGVEPRFIAADGSDSLDAIYVRDASVVTDRGAVLCAMGKTARQAEPAAQRSAYEGAGIEVLGRIEAPGKIEGGDLVWLDERTPVAGLGYRTNLHGVRQFRALAGDAIDSVITVPLPHWHGEAHCMHLMSLISPLDRELALVYSPLLPVPFRDLLLERGIGLVEVPDEEFETLGGNVLAVGPRRCIVVAGNPQTRRRLSGAGCEVIAFDADEICLKGEGGPTCLTRPLARTVTSP